MKNRVYPVALSLAVWSIPASAAWTNVSNGLTGSVPGVAALAIDLSVGSTLYALTNPPISRSNRTAQSRYWISD
jgi:hypothetical protein